MKKTNHYVNNPDFYAAIIEYQEKVQESERIGVDKPRISNYIGECIYKIATKLANKPCFMNYSFREEMIGDAIENCFLYFDRFDPEKSNNPFAYFTQIIYYAFLRRIQKEEKNRYAIYKNFNEMYMLDEKIIAMNNESETSLNKNTYDNIYDFMEKFEEKEKVKREKIRKKKLQGLQKFYEDEENENSTESSSTS